MHSIYHTIPAVLVSWGYWAILAGLLGENAGYFLGRHFGPTFLHWGKRRFRPENEDIQAAKDFLRRHGGRTRYSIWHRQKRNFEKRQHQKAA